jgi:hypothetical protein
MRLAGRRLLQEHDKKQQWPVLEGPHQPLLPGNDSGATTHKESG